MRAIFGAGVALLVLVVVGLLARRHQDVVAFRAMVGMGLLMLATSWVGVWLYRRARWRPERLPRALLWVCAGMTFSGWVATVAGWYVTEIGRQPWLVAGILRTADAVGQISEARLGASLTGYILTYAAMLVAYMVVLTHLAGKGAASDPAPTSHAATVPA